jgi:hypothetical protein
VAIANDGRVTLERSPALVSLQVVVDFLLNGGLEHLARPFGDELF